MTESFWSEVNTDGSGTTIRWPAPDVVLQRPVPALPRQLDDGQLRLLFAQGTDHFNSVRVLRGQARGVLAAQASGAFEPVRVEGPPPAPVPLAVSRPRPNPFSDATTVEVRGAAPEATLTVSVYDVLGRLVRAPEAVEGGSAEVGRGLAAGVYVVRVEGTGFAEAFPIVKVK